LKIYVDLYAYVSIPNCSGQVVVKKQKMTDRRYYNFNFSIISFDNAAFGTTILSVLIAK